MVDIDDSLPESARRRRPDLGGNLSSNPARPGEKARLRVPGAPAAVPGLDVLDANPRLWRAYLRALGPGLVTGASDDDPSGIATYAQAGAQFGFATVWVVLVTLPLMAGVQEICDRTALATGKSLGELSASFFGRAGRIVIGVLMAALIVANTLNIAADLVAVGAGTHLLGAGPGAVWAVVVGGLIMVLLVRGSFVTIARVFKVLRAALLAYVVVLFVVDVPWGTVGLNTVVPHIDFTRDYIALVIGVLGTTISPYLFFWQSLHRVEDMRQEPEGGDRPLALSRRSKRDAEGKLSRSRFDVFAGMTFSNLVMFAIIVATATTLSGHGHPFNITSAAQAASALHPVAGRFATTIFALGFIGSGFLAVPVLAGAGSAGMAGLLGRPTGFSRSPRRAPLFYCLCGVGALGGSVLSLLSVNPIKLLVLVAVANGLAAAPFIVVIMVISSNRAVMGEYSNGRVALLLGWLTVVLLAGTSVCLFATGGV